MALIVSPVHRLEIEAITDVEERRQLLLLLAQKGTQFEFDLPATRKRAGKWVAQGLGVAVAAHLAFAERAQADFVTVAERSTNNWQSRIERLLWPVIVCAKHS